MFSLNTTNTMARKWIETTCYIPNWDLISENPRMVLGHQNVKDPIHGSLWERAHQLSAGEMGPKSKMCTIRTLKDPTFFCLTRGLGLLKMIFRHWNSPWNIQEDWPLQSRQCNNFIHVASLTMTCFFKTGKTKRPNVGENCLHYQESRSLPPDQTIVKRWWRSWITLMG